ncbi:MAG: winged helix-turn-helix transcriptional regulator [Oscillospiraceae bacterium]|nr:winged helix-turn-helix transcriptional regulator [Oscillospiraceae bacterium]
MTQRERQILQLIEQNPMISQAELADQLGIARSSVAVHISNLIKKGCIAGKGYVLRTGSYAVVVGGVNMDIGGSSYAPLVDGDSNPGVVRMSLGGVGRNIAHNLSLMGTDVRLLTACGDDLYGQKIAASCSALGIDMSNALRLSNERTSTYLYITDPNGEMALAVSDMSICDRITPEYLASNLSLLQNAQVIVCDTNIPGESLAFLVENCDVPIFCDPVSTVKAEKLRPILGKLHTLKPNRIEAAMLSGVPIHNKADVEKAAAALLETGLRRVFISLGADGCYGATHSGSLWMPNFPVNLVNTTGCGDAFMAALVWAYLEGTDLEGTLRAGLAASSIAIETAETINPAMSAGLLKERISAHS